ncbi:MAG: hypothetical protein ACP5VS_09445 [Desulfomonilaceae bacterium]
MFKVAVVILLVLVPLSGIATVWQGDNGFWQKPKAIFSIHGRVCTCATDIRIKNGVLFFKCQDKEGDSICQVIHGYWRITE